MTNDDSHDPRLAKALERQKELQDTIKAATETIKAAMQELERLKQFLNMYVSFSPESETSEKRVSESHHAIRPISARLKGVAHGQTQAVFEALALDILRDVGRPMRSPEFIDEFRKRGQSLGGNEVRTAWNRLWQARKSGTLTHDVKLGYWIPGEPLSDEARESALEAGKRRPRARGPSMQALTRGKPKGPPRALTPDQVEVAERLLLSGKSRKEVCELFGGISMATLAGYVGRTADFMARHPEFVPPKPTYRPPRPGQKRGGRPRQVTPDQERQVLEMRAQGKPIREIIEATGIKRTTIYKIFDEQGIEVRKRADD